MPADLDLEIYRGDDFEKLFRWKDTSTDPDVYINLTGWTGVAYLRTSEDSAIIAETFSVVVDPDQTSPATAGLVKMSLSAAQTAELTGNATYVWDLQMTKPGGIKETYIKGTLTVLKDVTRP